jgi:hypothetical protein
VQGDVSKPEDLDRLYSQVKHEKGKTDVVFANAGIGGRARLDIGGNSIPPEGGSVGSLGEPPANWVSSKADQPVAGRVDHAGTDRIDADVRALEVGRPGAEIWAIPPSTKISLPVMKRLSSEARKVTTFADLSNQSTPILQSN